MNGTIDNQQQFIVSIETSEDNEFALGANIKIQVYFSMFRVKHRQSRSLDSSNEILLIFKTANFLGLSSSLSITSEKLSPSLFNLTSLLYSSSLTVIVFMY